jgi:excisionase family DNA binding protein
MCDQLLLTVVEAASVLRIGRSKLYQLLQSERLPSIQIDGARRILLSDLHAFVRKLKEASDSDG